MTGYGSPSTGSQRSSFVDPKSSRLEQFWDTFDDRSQSSSSPRTDVTPATLTHPREDSRRHNPPMVSRRAPTSTVAHDHAVDSAFISRPERHRASVQTEKCRSLSSAFESPSHLAVSKRPATFTGRFTRRSRYRVAPGSLLTICGIRPRRCPSRQASVTRRYCARFDDDRDTRGNALDQAVSRPNVAEVWTQAD
ncbi:hypothetical protein BDB13_1137 [Rhodococcus sp. OK302]|nr:hypothetical protein BDB13_1137 [Rhodococcus sp. OK302]